MNYDNFIKMILNTQIYDYNAVRREYEPVPEEFTDFNHFKWVWEPLFMLESYYSLTCIDGSGTKLWTTGKGWNCTLDCDDEDVNFMKIWMWQPNGEFKSFDTKGRMAYKEI